jgi:hypothetical protein
MSLLTIAALVAKLKRNMPRVYTRVSGTLVDTWQTAVASALQQMLDDGDAAIGQLSISTAQGPWLNQWGTLFNVPRRSPAEMDEAYAARIIYQTIQQRTQPPALEAIVQQGLGITVTVKDLWPYVLIGDQWTTPIGRPLQLGDGQLTAGVFTDQDEAVRGFAPAPAPYLPGNFGVWIYAAPVEPFSYTVENVRTLLPLVLFGDDVTPGDLNLGDGHLTTPQVGGPNDTARHGFAPQNFDLQSTADEVLDLINQHRAAGTQAVLMAILPDPATVILFMDDSQILSVATNVAYHETLCLADPNGNKYLVMVIGESGQVMILEQARGHLTPRTLTAPGGLTATLGMSVHGELQVTS